MTDRNGIPKLASREERMERFNAFMPASGTSPRLIDTWTEVFKSLSSFEEKDIKQMRADRSSFKGEGIRRLLKYLTSFGEKDMKNILRQLDPYKEMGVIESGFRACLTTKEEKKILNYLRVYPFPEDDAIEIFYYLFLLGKKDMTEILDCLSPLNERNITVILARLPSLPPDVKGADPVLVRAYMLKVICDSSGLVPAEIPQYLNRSMQQCYSQLWEDPDLGKEIWKQIEDTSCPDFGDLSCIDHYDLDTRRSHEPASP